MATALPITPKWETKSNRGYDRHIFRHAFLQMLLKIDAAVIAEKALEAASIAQGREIFHPASSQALRESEHAWDAVHDVLHALAIDAERYAKDCPLAKMAFAFRAIYGAGDGIEFVDLIDAARMHFDSITVTQSMNPAQVDAVQVVRAALPRLEALVAIAPSLYGQDLDMQPNIV